MISEKTVQEIADEVRERLRWREIARGLLAKSQNRLNQTSATPQEMRDLVHALRKACGL